MENQAISDFLFIQHKELLKSLFIKAVFRLHYCSIFKNPLPE